MSNPADIELADAGVPAWMAEESYNVTSHNNTMNVMTTAVRVNDAPSTTTLTTSAENTTTDTTNNNDSNINNTNSNNNADAASKKTWKQYFRESFQRDGRLLLITLGIIVCMNIPIVKWILYPFTIFSTWIHELCHGLAAVMAGGTTSKLLIFPDTSGLAYTASSWRGFVASAGYQGTAVIGFLLLIIRRTKRGPRTGTMVIACAMLLSCILWIRNVFGFIFIFCMGLVLAGLAWKLPSTHIRNLYMVLAVTCSLNAITSVHDLFGSNTVVNGKSSSTDAHTMAELTSTSYVVWAVLWLVLACVLTLMGILFAIPGPDEVADFTCCGVCQDFGLFKLCNYPGQRWTRRLGNNGGAEGGGGSGVVETNNNTVSGGP